LANQTPYRYPGAKNRLLSTIGQYLYPLVERKNVFIDCFVGGGSVLLDIAKKYPRIELMANDKDHLIASFWKVVSSSDVQKLSFLKEKLSITPTIDMFYELKKSPIQDEVDAAFRALFFNRTSFSGDMRKAASPIGGKKQLSKYKVNCRYNAKKILIKIDELNYLLKNRLTVSELDICSIPQWNEEGFAMYLDPPYFVAGKMLYEHSMNKMDHEKLANILSSSENNWVLSYDNCQDIREMYSWARLLEIDVKYCIKGEKTSWDKTRELIILPNLSRDGEQGI